LIETAATALPSDSSGEASCERASSDAHLDETVAWIATLLWPATKVAAADSSATAVWDTRRLAWRRVP
jgi:hypothetical protein